LSYPVWRRRFIATVHSQRMLISDKALALSTALDRKNETLGAMIGGLHYDPTTYAGLIAELERLYGSQIMKLQPQQMNCSKAKEYNLPCSNLFKHLE
jgi:hypothetical protein